MSTLFYLDVTGPSELLRARTTRPSDSEVFYLDETTQRLPDGQAVQTVITTTQTAVERFTATALAGGFGVQVRETPDSYSDIIEAIVRDNPPGRE